MFWSKRYNFYNYCGPMPLWCVVWQANDYPKATQGNCILILPSGTSVSEVVFKIKKLLPKSLEVASVYMHCGC